MSEAVAVEKRSSGLTLEDRAREISEFLGKPYSECIERLRLGFGYQHAQVALDWRRANPQTDEQILEWYRTTEQYIWELSAYHADPGFNYGGMCQGIAQRLLQVVPGGPYAYGAMIPQVLCLGDGIGDLTITMGRHGFGPWYHDLANSKTSNFALGRIGKTFGYVAQDQSIGWEPNFACGPYDAIVSLDFLEHVTQVDMWVKAIYDALNGGGIFVAQNAFAIGSGPDGSMPMHLARNDRFERDWDPLLSQIGFEQLSSNWYIKK